jgi:hypothetical protein
MHEQTCFLLFGSDVRPQARTSKQHGGWRHLAANVRLEGLTQRIQRSLSAASSRTAAFHA